MTESFQSNRVDPLPSKPSITAADTGSSEASVPGRLVYRPPTLDDLAAVAEIYNHAVRNTAATFDTEEKEAAHFEPFLSSNNLYRMLLATLDDEVVGYAGTYPFSQRQAYSQMAEMMIYVHPSQHRRGIGSKSLDEIHRGQLLSGFHTILVLINKENRHVQRAFEKHGYCLKGELSEVALKFGRRHSLLVYQRPIVGEE